MRGLSLVAASGGHSSSRCAGLSLSRPLLLRSTGSRRAGSVIVAHGPICSAACGIFPDQGSNPCPLLWQADSQPLRHQGSPSFVFLINELYTLLKKTWSSVISPFLDNFQQLWNRLMIIQNFANQSVVCVPAPLHYSKSPTYEPSSWELSKMRTCVCMSNHVKLFHVSGVRCHVHVCATSGCASVYFTVQYSIEYSSTVSLFQAQDVRK